MSRKGKNKSNCDHFDSTDLPSPPKGWRWTALENLAASEPNSITDGPFGSKLKTEHYTASGPRVVRLQNIGDGVFRNADAHISDEHFRTLNKHRVFAGDLVVAALGEVLPKACVVPESFGPAIVKADCIRVRLNEGLVNSLFVCYALNSEPVRRRTATIIHGVGRPRLNLREIKSVFVPVAPLNEQRRIVEKIEELFTDLDAGVAALKRARANLKRYRASVLNAAVSGSLTAEWRAKHPSIEPASKLLARILVQRRRKWEADQLARFAAAGKQPPKNWQAKYVEPVPPDRSNLPDLPEGWVFGSVDQLMTTITSGSRDWTRFYGRGSGTFIMAQNVRPGHFDRSYRQAVDPPENDRDKERSQVRCGDLLVTIVGANTGDVCRLPSDFAEHYVCQSVALMRPVEAAISQFAEFYFVADHGGQMHFGRYIYGQGRPHLSFDQIKMTPVVLPPITEQTEIIVELQETLSQIEVANVAIGRANAITIATVVRTRCVLVAGCDLNNDLLNCCTTIS